jgi:hypothetical protein
LSRFANSEGGYFITLPHSVDAVRSFAQIWQSQS